MNVMCADADAQDAR